MPSPQPYIFYLLHFCVVSVQWQCQSSLHCSGSSLSATKASMARCCLHSVVLNKHSVCVFPEQCSGDAWPKQAITLEPWCIPVLIFFVPLESLICTDILLATVTRAFFLGQLLCVTDGAVVLGRLLFPGPKPFSWLESLSRATVLSGAGSYLRLLMM